METNASSTPSVAELEAVLLGLSQELGALLQKYQQVLCTAESCTGGLLAGCMTDTPGSSQWYDRGFVTYTNAAKTQLIGVPPVLLAQYGAVSEPVVKAMAEGALKASPLATIALSTSGIAGPGGATPEKPVGTVCFGLAFRAAEGAFAETRIFEGDRRQVRLQAVAHILKKLRAVFQENEAHTSHTGGPSYFTFRKFNCLC